MNQKVIGFHKDSEDVWVADLACGHKRHVHHQPPMVDQAWVLDGNKRQQFLGNSLNCKRCDEVGLVVASAVRNFCLDVVDEAYLEAGYAAMCKEGQLELILDRLKTADLKKLSTEAIAAATTDQGTLS